MNIVVVGRGNVGEVLAALWRMAGHEVTAPGRDGGDASGADVVVVAVPGPAISAARGQATGAVAKSFNLNFVILHDQIAAQRVPPSSFYVADDGAPFFYRFAVPGELWASKEGGRA
jgi:hypothetical protein